MIEAPDGPREAVKEGWRDWVDSKPVTPPQPLTLKQIEKLDPAELSAHNLQRIAYASAMPPIRQLIDPVQKVINRALLLNQFKAPGARPGVVLDGRSANGKTTMLLEIGREYEREQRLLHPNEMTDKGAEFIPVLYISVDALPTLKSLNRAILEFYGIDAPRASANEMTSAVFQCIERCRTSLIMFDEIHMLSLTRLADRDANNHLKVLANGAKATFVYAGVELGKTHFMSEGFLEHEVSRSQISRRFQHIKVEPIDQNDPKQQALLSGILKVYEENMKLARTRKGDLVKLSPYIWRRTQGVIGSIRRLILDGFVEAVITGTERFSKELLATIQIDQEAEEGFEKYRELEHRDLGEPQ